MNPITLSPSYHPVHTSIPPIMYLPTQGTSTRGHEKLQYLIYTHHPALSHITLMTKGQPVAPLSTSRHMPPVGGWLPGKHDGSNMWQWYREAIIAVRGGKDEVFLRSAKDRRLPGKRCQVFLDKVPWSFTTSQITWKWSGRLELFLGGSAKHFSGLFGDNTSVQVC